MNEKMLERGAQIIINRWVSLQKDERLCIVTSNLHYKEALVLEEVAAKKTSKVSVMIVPEEGIHVGNYFDDNPRIFDTYDVIIGASDYSIVTTKACDRAIKRGKRFLSLPLSTNNGVSMLEYDFLTMDTNVSKLKAEILIGYIKRASRIRVETDLGTDITFSMKRRKPGFFNGTFYGKCHYASSSIEVYIPIVETETNGTLILDGSFGYIGKVEEPVKISFQGGKIVSIENNAGGKKLDAYMKGYNDERMYYGVEFGIGLNSISRCEGNCYIEDESTYGTFHIGLGRNIALGGKFEASGHFDLVTTKPSIWFDNQMVMNHGTITIPEFEM